VIDKKVAAENVRIFEDDMKHSERLTREAFESRPWYVKMADYFCGMLRSQF
jgi:phosphatidylserine/phosphatidylglycerophosphate/cardiolipin synthase-like enzyme